MLISVISPDRRQGATSVSVLLSLAIAQTQNLTTCLTSTGKNSSINSYLGIEEAVDRTKNLTQVVKLLEANAISGDEISDYCTRVGVNLHLFDTESNNIEDSDRAKLLQFALENLNHDIVITDVATEIFEEVTEAVIEKSDLIVMVLSQTKDVWSKLKAWEEAGIMDKLNERGLIFIFNNYDANVGSFRGVTKQVGLRHRRCCRISYNPQIKKASNIGKLQTIMPFIVKKDPRVIELNNELKECMTVVLANLGRKMVWKD